jgi:hypothetical protein
LAWVASPTRPFFQPAATSSDAPGAIRVSSFSIHPPPFFGAMSRPIRRDAFAPAIGRPPASTSSTSSHAAGVGVVGRRCPAPTFHRRARTLTTPLAPRAAIVSRR